MAPISIQKVYKRKLLSRIDKKDKEIIIIKSLRKHISNYISIQSFENKDISSSNDLSQSLKLM